MSENAYRWASIVLLTVTAIGVLWTRHDVAELSGHVEELSQGHRDLVAALVE